MPGVVTYVNPLQIDLFNFGTQPPTCSPVDPSNPGITGMIAGPWEYAGSLYIVLISSFVGQMTGCSAAETGPVDVWASSDGGLTWATVDDAGAPQASIMWCAFDGDHTISVVFQLGTEGGTVPLQFSMAQFDLTTQTWGSPSVPNGENSAYVSMILSRPDASCLVVYSDSTGKRLKGVVFAVGAWGVSFFVDTGAVAVIPDPPVLATSNCFGVVDAGGTTHVFFDLVNGAGQNYLFYQAVEPSGVLGAFHALGKLAQGNGSTYGATTSYGIPCISPDNQLVLPILTDPGLVLSVWIGQPLGAPAWALYPAIDPGANLITGTILATPASAVIGGQVVIISVTPTADLVFQDGIIRRSVTSDFGSWGFVSNTAFDLEIDGVPPFRFGEQVLLSPLPSSQGLSILAVHHNDEIGFQRYWMQPVSSGLPPLQITFRGVKLFQSCDDVKLSEVPQGIPVKRAL